MAAGGRAHWLKVHATASIMQGGPQLLHMLHFLAATSGWTSDTLMPSQMARHALSYILPSACTQQHAGHTNCRGQVG